MFTLEEAVIKVMLVSKWSKNKKSKTKVPRSKPSSTEGTFN
jgi:hypothetical protein